jgi:hypothetical protein
MSSLSCASSVAGIQDIRNIFSNSETTKFPEWFSIPDGARTIMGLLQLYIHADGNTGGGIYLEIPR